MNSFVRSVVPAATLSLALVGSAFASSPATAAGDTWSVPSSTAITISGHGYGHGNGMSQHGAQGAALKGLSARQITDFYYPGTSFGRIKGKVSVMISSDPGNSLIVRPTKNLAFRELGGSKTRLPRNGAKLWRIKGNPSGPDTVSYRKSGKWKRWRKVKRTGEFNAGGRPIALVTPSGTKRFRGRLRAVPTATGARSRHTVNVLSLESYLRGVVPLEMPATWHPNAVKAQAIAARTYAAFERMSPKSSAYQLCDTTSCQVYGGADAEHPASDRAIAKTANRVRKDGKNPAFTQFSASNGGWSSTGSRPYLVAKEDPYDDWSGNSVHDWKVKVTDAAIERAFPAVGNLSQIAVLSRDGNGEWGGRVNQLTLTGSRGTLSVSGDDFRFKLSLRSNWMNFSVS